MGIAGKWGEKLRVVVETDARKRKVQRRRKWEVVLKVEAIGIKAVSMRRKKGEVGSACFSFFSFLFFFSYFLQLFFCNSDLSDFFPPLNNTSAGSIVRRSPPNSLLRSFVLGREEKMGNRRRG
jgi:hypothetical protein